IVHRGLWYPKDSSIALTAFADADHVGCQDTRRSTSGSMQLLGDRLVSWSSKRQKSAAISSTEAEGLSKDSCFISHEDYTHFYRLSHSELVDIEKVAVCSSLRSLKSKCTIESRAKRDHL
ncbi:hypothetical protein Tco_0888478, partial [Tanacetum coccineum]